MLLHSVWRISWPCSTHYSEFVLGGIKGGEEDMESQERWVWDWDEGIMRREGWRREITKCKRVIKREGAHLCRRGICALKPNAEVRNKLMWKVKGRKQMRGRVEKDHWKSDSKRERQRQNVKVTDFWVSGKKSSAGVNVISACRSEADT